MQQARQQHKRAVPVLVLLGLLYALPAQPVRADELCIDEDHARSLYDYGWQALQAHEWATAYGHLQFFYLLTVSGPVARDWSFMQELIAAKNHAFQQIAALEEDNRRLRAQLAQAQTTSGGYSASYKGQTITPEAPALRRSPPRAR